MAEDPNPDTPNVRIEAEKNNMVSRSPSSTDSIESAGSHPFSSSDISKPTPQSTTVLTEDGENDGGGGGGNTGDNPFSDPNVAARYREVYERAHYECRGVFDPQLTWTPAEERKLVRRIDRRVCLWACIMFFALQVDRGNIGQAVSDNMLQELGMDTNDFNLANTIFTVTFLAAELPSQLISKKIGPDRWVPTLITTWSVIAILQAVVTGKQGFFALRAILGLLVGGFVPDIVLWLSYFYTSKELPIRLSIFWTTISISGIVTTFSGLGILFLRGRAGWSGWRWLFLIQGLITLTIGVSSFFMMPPSIVQTKNWFRPKGWFTEREEAIAVNRILRDDPSKGDMHNRQAITLPRLWKAAKNYDLWPIYLLSFLTSIPTSPPGNYLTITLRNLGFSTFVTNLLTVPSSIAHIFTLLAFTWLSERFSERTFFAMAQNVWSFPCLIALRVWPGVVKDVWGTYALVTVLLSYPSSQAIMVGWLSKNSNNVGTRSVSVAFSNIILQLSNIYSNNIYREQDSPLYHKGNTDLIIINAVCLLSFGLTKVFYILRNKHRDRVWASMAPEERYEYTHYSQDMGTRRLDFRFAH